MTAPVRQKMQRYVDEHPRGKHGQILYDLQADFGIDPHTVEAILPTYMVRYRRYGQFAEHAA